MITPFDRAIRDLRAARLKHGVDSREAGLARNRAVVMLMQYEGEAWRLAAARYQFVSHGRAP